MLAQVKAEIAARKEEIDISLQKAIDERDAAKVPVTQPSILNLTCSMK